MKTILLVEDDPALRLTLVKSLTRASYNVIEAADGEKALKVLGTKAVDLVITDLVMPEKEGIELIISLRNRQPPVKVIAISGGGHGAPEDYLAVAQALGAFRTLAKPFTTEEILSAITAAFASPAP